MFKSVMIAFLVLSAGGVSSAGEVRPSKLLSSLGGSHYLAVAKDFVFPKGDYFYFRNGEAFVVRKGEERPDFSCTFSPPFTVNRYRDEVTYSKMFRRGERLEIGDAVEWKRADGVHETHMKFYDDRFEMNCVGTADKRPNVADLERHFGGSFRVKAGRKISEAKKSDARVKNGGRSTNGPRADDPARGRPPARSAR